MKKRLPLITMKCFSVLMSIVSVVIFIAVLAAGPALAEKPSWTGNGKGAKQRTQHEVNQRYEEKRRPYFSEQHRVFINDYYAKQYRRGHCPPGLAKKHNGCMPPGQAKKWVIGQPLPRDVIFYDLPPGIPCAAWATSVTPPFCARGAGYPAHRDRDRNGRGCH